MSGPSGRNNPNLKGAGGQETVGEHCIYLALQSDVDLCRICPTYHLIKSGADTGIELPSIQRSFEPGIDHIFQALNRIRCESEVTGAVQKQAALALPCEVN